MVEDVLWAEPDPMILYYRRVLALIPLHVAGDLILKLGEILLHPLVEVAYLLLDVHGGEPGRLVGSGLPSESSQFDYGIVFFLAASNQ